MAVGMVPILISLMSAVGLGLLVWGLRGRRVGDEPRCRRCRYELTGLVSPNCPECGTEVDWARVRRGMRRRRPVAIVVAVVFLLVAGTGATIFAKKVSWYVYCPTRGLISLAGFGDLDALKELESRWKTGSLSAAQTSSLAEACLRRQALTPKKKDLQQWKCVEVLEALDVGGRLSEAQQERYYKQIIHGVKLQTRKVARQGEHLPVRVCIPGHAPWAGLMYSYRDGGFSINGNRMPRSDLYVDHAGKHFGSFGNSSSWQHTATSAVEVTAEPGPHRLQSKGIIELRRGTERIRQMEVEASCDITVASSGAKARVEMVPEPDPEVLKKSLRIFVSGRRKEESRIYVNSHLVLPVSVAYEAFVRSGGGDLESVGRVWGESGDDFLTSMITVSKEIAATDNADLILRPSADIAESCLVDTKISSLEILFADVKFAPRNPGYGSEFTPTSVSLAEPRPSP